MSQTYSALLQSLQQCLSQYQDFWRLQPMQSDWPAHWPAELLQQLQQLSLEQCWQIDANPQLQQQYFGRFFVDLWPLCAEFPLIEAAPVQPPFWLEQGIAGRKWQQICSFAGAVQQSHSPVLEWCAGKGHLGRVLSFTSGQSVTSIEWQATLCDAGAALAKQHQLPQQFVCADVLTQDVTDLFQTVQQVVALHACGDLHRRCLAEAVAVGCTEINLVPCCYHLQQQTTYQPFCSKTQLPLSRQELRLAVQGYQTGGQRVARLAQTEMLWRQAARLWGQQSGGQTAYQPLPSVAKHWFSGEFADFIQWAATTQQLPAPTALQLPQLLEQASAALLQQRRLELVQHLFRRPIEHLLVLDMAVYLQQQQYQVQINQLCDSQLTPRNLLLSARKVDCAAAELLCLT